MRIFIPTLFVCLSATAVWLLLAVLVPKLRNNILDRPNSRSAHIQPTPRGGGISFVFIFSLSCFFYLCTGFFSFVVVLPLLVLPLAVIGLIDDKYNLPSSWRYSVQIFTAVLIFSVSPILWPFVSALFPQLLISALLLIAVTAIINFVNFMDGLDGLVGGCMFVIFLALAIYLSVPWPVWTLVGGLLGFLCWNWSPAKVFMGDVGSTFLGAFYIGLVLQASSWSQSFAMICLATPLLADSSICVLRRFLAGHKVFLPHRLHLFQRLYQSGWSHSRVSLAYILATAVLSVALLMGGLPWVLGLAVVELFVGFWLDQRVAVPFFVASKT